jgi:hypothetical protein
LFGLKGVDFCGLRFFGLLAVAGFQLVFVPVKIASFEADGFGCGFEADMG